MNAYYWIINALKYEFSHSMFYGYALMQLQQNLLKVIAKSNKHSLIMCINKQVKLIEKELFYFK